jgi:hypothetical protein
MKDLVKKFTKEFFPEKEWKIRASSQNDDEESSYLIWLCREIDASKSFVEFGFGIYEFNSVSLVKSGYRGMLLDGGEENCKLANRIFSNLNLNVTALAHWITLETLEPIETFVLELDNELGVLNVDIDGNDYWILKSLLFKFQPQIICVEHNASFQFKPITTPYKPEFDRHTEHASGLYHGASITAFYNLLSNSYCLVKNIAGLNLIFVRKDMMTKKLVPLRPKECYSQPLLRNKLLGTNAEQQWEIIKNLKFVNVN